MKRYLETFRRHRLLLGLPMVLAIIVTCWSVAGSPKTYESKASLWVDNPAPADSSLGNVNPAVLPPSQQEQNVITELLATHDFTTAVGRNSMLGPYLATHPTLGWSPTALLSGLGGAGSLDDRITAAVAHKVVTAIPGPQVLQINYQGPTPAVARSTLAALLSELKRYSVQFNQEHSQGALTYYKSQVQSAAQAVAAARNQLNSYLSHHPGASAGDPNLSALTAAEGLAGTQLTQATTSLNTAAGSLHGGGAGTVNVVDTPSLPTAPTSGKKKIVLGLFGGLFAGALISLLGAIALSPRVKPEAWEDELRDLTASSGLTPSPGQDHFRGDPVSLRRDFRDAAQINGGVSAATPELRHSNGGNGGDHAEPATLENGFGETPDSAPESAMSGRRVFLRHSGRRVT